MNKRKIKTAGNAADKSVIPKTPVRFILHISNNHKVWALSAIFMVIVASAAGQSANIFFKIIVDAAERGDTSTALVYGLLFPVAVFVVQSLYRVSGWLGKNWTIGVEKDSYDKLVSYATQHSHGYYTDRFAGSILSKVSNVVRATTQFIPDFLWTHLNTFVTFFITYVFIASIDFMSGVIFLVLVIVLIIVNRLLAPPKMKLSKEVASASTKLRGNIVDLFSNAATMRQHAMAKEEIKNIGGSTQYVKEIHGKSWTYTEKVLLLNSAILFLATILMFYTLVTRWSSEDITTGDFVFIIALVSQITGALIFVGRAFVETAKALGEAEEGLEDLLVPYEIEDKENAKRLVVREGNVVWSNVSFNFENNHVFKDFNLDIPSGQRVGLVGSSGAGKTTFVSLLLRQHDISVGSIEIDGQKIDEVTQDSLRKNIAVVPQEPLLFHRTIKENISYGKVNATQKEIEDVAKKAQAHDFIREMSKGYDTIVGERGIKLSGGQKQRIAIARAMLKNAPILVLDEATSALDSESEVAIQKALHELMEGKTVIAVAHRLSTLREMDRILVLDNGKIIEDGTHDDLSKAGGVYQRLWEHQSGGFVN